MEWQSIRDNMGYGLILAKLNPTDRPIQPAYVGFVGSINQFNVNQSNQEA